MIALRSTTTATAMASSTRRKPSTNKGVNLSGIEWGHGGVWLTAVPNLIFIPDRDADDKPDGDPVVILDGWDLAAKHNVVNGLAWGPDGYSVWIEWHSVELQSRQARLQTRGAERRSTAACGGFDPKTHEFEPFAYGTTNPWGLDWNEHGQLFITNCVIKHLVSRRARRSLRADVWAGSQSTILWPDSKLCGPSALGRRALDEFPWRPRDSPRRGRRSCALAGA